MDDHDTDATMTERMTYRERREARAARLREWSEKRQAKAEAGYKAGAEYRGDTAFWTQPGRIPERDRIHRARQRAGEDATKAAAMRVKAASIEGAAERAIYSDDPDAIVRLHERIAELESRREQMKAENAAYCKAHLSDLMKMTAFMRDSSMPHPGYELQNLGGNLSKQRARLAELARGRE